MQKILKAIYDGELRIVEARESDNPEYKAAMTRYLEVQRKIMDALPAEHSGLVDDLSTANADVNGVVCQEDLPGAISWALC